LILAGMVWSGLIRADSRYPKEEQIREVFKVQAATNVYLDSKISILELKERRADVQSRLWALEKEFKGTRMPESVLAQKIALENDLRDIDEAVTTYRSEAAKSIHQGIMTDSPKAKSSNPYLQRGN